MNNIMIDTSVWIEYLRKGKGTIFDQLDLLLDQDRAALCGVVELEIIQGIRKKERKAIRDLFGALSYLETERADFIYAGELLNNLRKKGITIPSSDCIIAAMCVRRDLPILTLDNHFDSIKYLNKLTVSH